MRSQPNCFVLYIALDVVFDVVRKVRFKYLHTTVFGVVLDYALDVVLDFTVVMFW